MGDIDVTKLSINPFELSDNKANSLLSIVINPPYFSEVEKQVSIVKGAGMGGLGSKVAQKGTIVAFEGSKTAT